MDNKELNATTDNIRTLLHGQFTMSWQLLQYHLHDLEDSECHWQPRAKGLHVYQKAEQWQADWPESESYASGPASIAWVMWHILFWWSMAVDHSFGEGKLTREEIRWPGSAAAAKKQISSLCDQWNSAVALLTAEELTGISHTRWPFADKPFYELAAWLNVELMKNAAEIGYCRFLYATRLEGNEEESHV